MSFVKKRYVLLTLFLGALSSMTMPLLNIE